MRDGVKLFTSVYAPKDPSRKYPILIQRTPYSAAPYGINNYPEFVGPSDLFTKEGFIFVKQDVRGRYLSEGAFIDMPPHKTSFSGPADTDESTDTYDTIDWLIKNVPNNNGRAGMWGVSYDGFYADYGLMNSHPALKAVSPQAPMGDVGNGDDAYHNGAFYLAANFGFYTGFTPRGPEPSRPLRQLPFDFGTPDEYNFYLRMGPLSASNETYLKHKNVYWDDNLKHSTYDEFWQTRAHAPHMKNTTPAVMFVGGWFDAEDLSGPLKLFRAVKAGGPKAPNTLVMGPWRHGGWRRGDDDTLGNLRFDSKTGDFFREQIELSPSSCKTSRKKATGCKLPKTPKYPKPISLKPAPTNGSASTPGRPKMPLRNRSISTPTAKLVWDAPKTAGTDEYISDPAKPVPVIGEPGPGMSADYMTYDQRFASSRPDVLTYQTDPLDHDITIAGPVTPSLQVSTSGTDSDFIVKLIDVYPNDYPDPNPNPKGVHMPGYQQMVRGEPIRGKFRNSFSKPEPFVPPSARQSGIRDARYLPHLPPRPSHYGADSELLVPAYRSQPPAVPHHPRRQSGGS